MSLDIGPLLDVIRNALNLKLVRVVVNQRLNTSLQGSDSCSYVIKARSLCIARFWKIFSYNASLHVYQILHCLGHPPLWKV